jgi:RHS repeat-associated protein
VLTGIQFNVDYQYQIITRDAGGNVTTSEVRAFRKNNLPVEDVSWTDLVGVTAAGSTLTKTAATGWGNGGAASVQRITGDGKADFTAVSTGTNRVFGLSNSNANAYYNTIRYALYAQSGGTLRVYELGVSRWQGTYVSGDVLSVERNGATVYYRKNGNLVYTSAAPSTGDLIADVAINTLNGQINNARIYGGTTISGDLNHSPAIAMAGVESVVQEATVQEATVVHFDGAGSSEFDHSARNGEPDAAHQRALLVVEKTAEKATENTAHKIYAVYRYGPETHHTWQQTAEDPNSHDRPDTVYYVSADHISVWQSRDTIAGVNAVSVERLPLTTQALVAALTAGHHNAHADVRVGEFIKVSHGTASSPVSIDSEVWSYTYDANGNIEDIRSSSGDKFYAYDALNRLLDDTRSGYSSETFDYDRNGNRTAKTVDAVTDSYGYITNSNQLSSDPQGSVIHDPAGNRTRDQGGNRTFEYNDAGRLWKVYEGGQLIATYIYNAQGQRTRKITDTQTTVYHYDLSGNLISETTATGAALKDYVHLNSVPVAQIDTDGVTDTVSYLHTDHLGTPRRATNAQGDVVWSWDSDAFGTTAANDDPDNDGTAAIINLRFAGQYYDAETGLHYNYFRYYDPRTGRYVTSDPIGLDGGLNTYGYVSGNPLMYVDPMGLRQVCWAEEKPMMYNGIEVGTYKGITCVDMPDLPMPSRCECEQNQEPSLMQTILPAMTSQLSRNPIGGSVASQLEFARVTQCSRYVTYQAGMLALRAYRTPFYVTTPLKSITKVIANIGADSYANR